MLGCCRTNILFLADVSQGIDDARYDQTNHASAIERWWWEGADARRLNLIATFNAGKEYARCTLNSVITM